MPDWGMYLILAAVGIVGLLLVPKGDGEEEETVYPPERAYIEVNFHSIDANKEVAIRKIELEHEEQMALIERGAFDPALEKVGYPEEEDDDDDD
jgi:hypothetical protein